MNRALESLLWFVASGLTWGLIVTAGLIGILYFFYFIFGPNGANTWYWSLLLGPLGTAAIFGLFWVANYCWSRVGIY